jgi:glutamine synthetase
LWSDEQFEAAVKADKWIEEYGLEVVRLSFPDQHGILRGKSVMANEAAAVMRNGCSMTTTLLAKDTAHKTAFPGLHAWRRLRHGRDGGRRRLPHDRRSHHVPRAAVGAARPAGCCATSISPTEKPVPFSTRHLYRRALHQLAEAGFNYMAGLEVEFHVFKLDERRLKPSDADLAGRAARGQPGLPGLPVPDRDTARPDGADPRERCAAISSRSACRCARSRSSSGPSQCEFTFHPQVGCRRPTP